MITTKSIGGQEINMKVALVTMNVLQGKCEENFSFMMDKIQQAKKDHVDMIVFPQNAISGYLLGDQWLDDAWCRYVDSFNDRLVEESEDIAIVWGNIRYRNQRRFNAAFFAYQKKTHMRVKKNVNADYQCDARYFEESSINSAIEFKNYVLALNFQNEITLADLNINIDAHPYDMEEANGLYGNVVYVNAVGMQNQGKNVMVMQGGSYVHNQRKLLYQASYFQADYAVVDIHAQKEVQPQKKHLLDALTLGIREFDKQIFNAKMPWIIGLSGGLDSSVSCALLAYALGAKRVHGFNMATKYNRDTTISNAQKEAAALGIHYHDGSIQMLVDASRDTFLKEYGFDAQKDSTLVMENIQARARGYLLGGFAGILGGVIANNGNKVEYMLGYCTLYGDSVGALSLIGDLTKVQLFALAEELNKRFAKEVVPMNLLPVLEENKLHWEMAPSAELKEDQYDPMKWFYHDYLVDNLGRDLDVLSLMEGYLNHTLEEELMKWIKYYQLDEPQSFIEDLDWFLNTASRNGFKRLQTPPMLCVHKRSLASQIDAQMQVDRTQYEQLKQRILAM